MVQLKSAREIEVMAAGGRLLAETHALMARELRPGMTTWDIDRIAEEFIAGHPGARAAFKGLYGFPGSVCTSVNEEIVHGIPSKKRVLYFTSLFPCWSETFIVREIDELIRLGVDVRIVSLKHPIEKMVQNDAQALLGRPRLLILDEPTNGLDPRAREEMLELIIDLPKKRGCAVLLSTG